MQSVQIRLKMYKGLLASNFREYARFHIHRLSVHARIVEETAWKLDDVLVQVSRQMKRIAQVWTAFLYENTSIGRAKGDVFYQELLKQGFEKYRKRYAEQEGLIHSGAFNARLVSAMAKMPAAKGLEFPMSCRDPEKEDPGERFFLFKQAADDTFLSAYLLEDWKLSGGHEEDWQSPGGHEPLATHPLSLISAILAGFDTTDVNITSLWIELPSGHPDFVMLNSTAEKIRSAMQGLEVLTVVNDFPSMPCGYFELDSFRDFLAPVINTERLEKLYIDLGLWGEYGETDPVSIPFVSVIKPRVAWPALSRLTLQAIRIRFSELEHVLRSIRPGAALVLLGEVNLMDGSWAAILDILRDRHRGAQLRAPSGAECEAMFKEEYEKIFDRYYYQEERDGSDCSDEYEAEASRYIQGLRSTNPLLHPDSAEPA